MGGNAFDNLRRIKKDEIKPTINWLISQINLPNLTYEHAINNLMGSTGKQADSGDIDIALNDYDKEYDIPVFTRKDLVQIASALRSILGNDAVYSKGIPGGQLNLKVPILGDESNGFVQVDFILGPSQWLKFSHHSPGKDHSPYKGVMISTLLGVMAKMTILYKLESEGELIARVSYAYDLEKGLYLRYRLKVTPNQGLREVDADYFESNIDRIARRYGKTVRVPPRFNRSGYIHSPENVVKILFGPDVTPNDIDTFEKAWRQAKIRFAGSADELKERTIEALARSGLKYDFPTKYEIEQLPIFNESILERLFK